VKLYYQDEPRLYTVNGKKVPSVTTILKVLAKDALPWWGMKVGVNGVFALLEQGVIHPYDFERPYVPELGGRELTPEDFYRSRQDADDLGLERGLLTEHKLTTNDVLEDAGDRGNSVHTALEDWTLMGEMPDPELFPEEERGYVNGLVTFLRDVKLTPVASEVMVGSVEHEYAGRFDLIAELPEQEATVRASPKRSRRAIIPAGRYMLDLKTSKGIYDSHHLQLSGYEGALRECGYGGTEHRAVVRPSPDGRYEIHLSPACYPEWLAVVRCHRAMQTFTSKLKEAKL
jgi:hypothetical protein